MAVGEKRRDARLHPGIASLHRMQGRSAETGVRSAAQCGTGVEERKVGKSGNDDDERTVNGAVCQLNGMMAASRHDELGFGTEYDIVLKLGTCRLDISMDRNRLKLD